MKLTKGIHHIAIKAKGIEKFVFDVRLDVYLGALVGHVAVMHEDTAARDFFGEQRVSYIKRLEYLERRLAVKSAIVGEIKVALRLSGGHSRVVRVVEHDSDDVVLAVAYKRADVGNEGNVSAEVIGGKRAVDIKARYAHSSAKFNYELFALVFIGDKKVFFVDANALIVAAAARVCGSELDTVRQAYKRCLALTPL